MAIGVTLKIILKTGKVWLNSKGEYPVKLRATFNRKQKFYSLKNESSTKEEFELLMNPKSKGDRAKKRLQYENVLKKAEHIVDGLVEFSFDSFELEFLENKKQRSVSILDYFNNKALELDSSDKIQTATLYRTTIKSLLSFDPKITFQKITPEYLKRYQNWMVENDHSYTTVGMYLRNLKHIINRAINAGLGIDYPFGNPKEGKYQIPQGKNTKKALGIDEVKKLYTYQPIDQNELLAQKYWMFSYLANGMNMADVANLKYKNIKQNNIEFIRQKTKDTSKEVTTIRIFITPELLSIIDKIGNIKQNSESYLFPIYEQKFNQLEKHRRLKQHIKNTNKYIRRIAKAVGVDENITTYWARHSYATVLKRSGAPIEFLQEQLGHQTSKTTQNYLDSFEDEHRAKYSANLLSF